MRIAIITDIHEDFEMLEKAFAQIRSLGYDLLVCLGDVTGFAHQFYDHPPDANACLDLLRAHAHLALAGNHDLFTAHRLPSYHIHNGMPENWYELSFQEQFSLAGNKLWLYEEEVLPALTGENLAYLKSLPEYRVYDTGQQQVLFSHFLKPDLAGVSRWFPNRTMELRPHFRFMEENDCRLAFAGHCHPEGLNLVSKLLWAEPGFSSARMNRRSKIVLCPAVVNGRNSSGFTIFDSETGLITPYPLS
jgi:predicted phosphodiesterase